MYNYDVSNYMQKYFAPNDGVPGGGGEKPRKPRTRLSKWLAKIAGVYDGEMEPKTEAEYYLNEIAENGVAGGGVVPEADEEGLVLTTGTKGNKITIIDTHITTPELRSNGGPYQGTWTGFDESLIKWPAGLNEGYYFNGTIDGNSHEYIIANDIEDGHCIVADFEICHIKFFPNGTFRAWLDNKGGKTSFYVLDADFFLDIDKIDLVWAPMPKGTVTATASNNFVGSHSDSTLDMTAEEIITALSKGPVFVHYYISILGGPIHHYGIVMRMDTGREGTPYYFRVLTYSNDNGAPVVAVFTASSITDYPVCSGT